MWYVPALEANVCIHRRRRRGGGVHCAPPPPTVLFADVRIRAKFGQIRAKLCFKKNYLLFIIIIIIFFCRDNLKEMDVPLGSDTEKFIGWLWCSCAYSNETWHVVTPPPTFRSASIFQLHCFLPDKPTLDKQFRTLKCNNTDQICVWTAWKTEEGSPVFHLCVQCIFFFHLGEHWKSVRWCQTYKDEYWGWSTSSKPHPDILQPLRTTDLCAGALS